MPTSDEMAVIQTNIAESLRLSGFQDVECLAFEPGELPTIMARHEGLDIDIAITIDPV